MTCPISPVQKKVFCHPENFWQAVLYWHQTKKEPREQRYPDLESEMSTKERSITITIEHTITLRRPESGERVHREYAERVRDESRENAERQREAGISTAG